MKIGVVVAVVFSFAAAWTADFALEHPPTTTILVVGGSDASVLRTLSARIPWYQRTIDVLVATSSFVGMTYVLERYHVRYIFVPPAEGHGDTWYAFKRALIAARRSGSLIIHTHPGQQIDLGSHVIVLQ